MSTERTDVDVGGERKSQDDSCFHDAESESESAEAASRNDHVTEPLDVSQHDASSSWITSNESNASASSNSHSDTESDNASSCSREEEQSDEASKFPMGCEHYRRKCKVISPCCGKVFWCRHCHNEEMNTNEKDFKKAHEINRHAVEEVVCAACDTRQPVSNKCTQCAIIFGNFYCPICKFWDDKGLTREIYHCDKCGICRAGGRHRFFHCNTCGSCYPLELQNKHKCLENAMHRSCPVCLEDMFSSTRQSQILCCGHTIHSECLRQLRNERGFQALRCPVCCKSMGDYSTYWQALRDEIANIPLTEEFKKSVSIMCNDCNQRSTTDFHFVGLQCTLCKSFNTRNIDGE